MRWLCMLTLLAACSDSDAREDRLIQRNDSQFSELERPENEGECTLTSECVDNCLHSCTPESVQPMTCPVEPVPLPSRLIGATCACAEGSCKWL